MLSLHLSIVTLSTNSRNPERKNQWQDIFKNFGILEPHFAVTLLILGSFRLDYEYEIEYEYDFSILVFRLHIVTTRTHFIPWATLSA